MTVITTTNEQGHKILVKQYVEGNRLKQIKMQYINNRWVEFYWMSKPFLALVSKQAS